MLMQVRASSVGCGEIQGFLVLRQRILSPAFVHVQCCAGSGSHDLELASVQRC